MQDIKVLAPNTFKKRYWQRPIVDTVPQTKQHSQEQAGWRASLNQRAVLWAHRVL